MPVDPQQQQKETEAGGHPVEVPTTKAGIGAFDKLRRELTEDELASPGARRLLLSDRDRLDDEVKALQKYLPDYYKSQAECQVLKERLKTHLAIDLCWGLGLAAGFGLIGVVNNFWDKQPVAAIVLGIAFILIAGAVAVRLIKK